MYGDALFLVSLTTSYTVHYNINDVITMSAHTNEHVAAALELNLIQVWWYKAFNLLSFWPH